MPWAEAAFHAINWGWYAAGALCLAAAAVLLGRPGLVRVPPSRERVLALGALGAGLPLFAAMAKLAQHRNFQLTADSAHVLNTAWNFSHGNGLYSGVYGIPALGGHFQLLTPALLSPLLLLWESVDVLVAVHGLALGSCAWAVYLLARGRGLDVPLRWALAALALGHPGFANLLPTQIEDSVLAAPLFLWAALAWESRRPAPAALLLGLLLTTKEEAVAPLFGVGAFLLLGGRRRLGGALMLSAALLGALELRVMHWNREGLPWDQSLDVRIDARALLDPRNLWPLVRALASTAGLPLLSGPALLVALAAWVPHHLAPSHYNYHHLLSYYGAFLYGPLLWAAVIGAQRARATRWLPSFVLAVAGAGFLSSAGYYNPRLMPSAWRESVPAAAALVPRESRLWCESYLLPHFALRRDVKPLPRSLPDRYFEWGGFVPDHVLMSAYWARLAEPDAVRRIDAFLKERGYRPVYAHKDLLLLERPGWRTAAPEPFPALELDSP